MASIDMYWDKFKKDLGLAENAAHRSYELYSQGKRKEAGRYGESARAYSSILAVDLGFIGDNVRHYGDEALIRRFEKLEAYVKSVSSNDIRVAYNAIRTIKKIVDPLRRNLYELKRKKNEEIAKAFKESTVTLATVAIILLSMVGLASYLYVQSEPTARVVSPAVANLPVGIVFLAILVIGIITMPKLRR